MAASRDAAIFRMGRSEVDSEMPDFSGTVLGRTLNGGWRAAAAVGLLSLAACTTVPAERAAVPSPPVAIQILAINDFHGNLEAPAGTTTFTAGGQEVREQLGGAARLGATLAKLREWHESTITVAAGDLIGGSPLVSAYYLDEPSIMALNRMGLALASVGNHEFDKGTAELRRMQEGGCEVHTPRVPCRLDKPFEGARFTYLAANVIAEATGQPLFPGTAIREFGGVKIGFIGMTLKDTATLVSPAGTAGYRFEDEADTANRLAAELKAQGADAVVVLIHQGGNVDPFYNQDGCPQLQGDILPVLGRLDPAIRLVVSGHTHKAYICEVPASDGSIRLLTSAGRYGYFVTDIRLTVDRATDRVVSMSAVNTPVITAAGEQQDIAALVGRYSASSVDVASRVVGRIDGSLDTQEGAIDAPLARLVADAQLASTRDPARGAAEIAFINSGGVRSGFRPATDGSVTYGQIFALQPFGNTVEVIELTGAQLKQVIEQEFTNDGTGAFRQSYLIPSQGFAYTIDRTAPDGRHVVAMTLNGQPIDPNRTYRVAVNNFLQQGGDGFTVFPQGRFIAGGGNDLDALEAFIASGARASTESRIAEK
jgi:5'-nucleotidase